MRILVTGGAGYIGSALTQHLLEHGHTVRGFDNLSSGGEALLAFWSHPRYEFVRGDVRDRAATAHALDGMDAVVHLAAIVGDPACARQPDLARSINLDGALSLIEQSRAAGIQRFVFASTCSNYGKMPDPSAYVDEESPLNPLSLYAETKVAVERTLFESDAAGDMCATPLRFSTVFGISPRLRFDLTVNEFTMELLTKKKLVVFGEQFWRPYIHVRDAAAAIALVLDAPREKINRQVFNVGGTDQNYRKQEIVELIQPYVPDAVVEYVHKAQDPRDYRVSFERIKSVLGFVPTRSVPDGIAEVVRLVQSGVITDFDNPHYRN